MLHSRIWQRERLMVGHRELILSYFAASVVLSPSLWAGTPVNRVINGDAETGDMTGWTPIDQFVAVDSSSTGELGLLKCETLGQYSFTGGLGSPTESASQIIDVSDEAVGIDAGDREFHFTGLIQSRRAGGGLDVGTIEITLRDAANNTTASYELIDNTIANGVFDWERLSLSEIIPASTRSIEIVLIGTRNSGSSIDCFFDNLELRIQPPQCSSADLTRDGQLNFFEVSRFLSAYNTNDPEAEFTGDCQLDFFDVSAFLSAYNAGCI